jgi:hypothetical protein
MGVCNVLLTVCEAAFENLFSGLKNNRWVGDFQVATRANCRHNKNREYNVFFTQPYSPLNEIFF